MELLGSGLRYVYQAVLDRRSGQLFSYLSRLIADQIYDGPLPRPGHLCRAAGD